MASTTSSYGVKIIVPTAYSRRSKLGNEFGGSCIALDHPICNPAGKQRRSARMVLAVKAMAKYKGTLMREKKLTEMIESKVKEAMEVCEGDRTSDECKVAWDEVEEVSQAKADLRRKLKQDQDPLESYCQENPETDECRVYEE